MNELELPGNGTEARAEQPGGMTRRRFVASAGALAAWAMTGSWSAAAEPLVGSSVRASDVARCRGDSPNVVFILADDLGYGEIGPFGQQRIATPHLDQLAAEGIRFTDCYAAPACAPSRCVLLTGMHTGHSTVRASNSESELRPEDITFGEVLQAAGYRTGIVGKWGFGPLNQQVAGGVEPGDDVDNPSHPNRKGFDEFFGQLGHSHANQKYPDHLWENFDRYQIPENHNNGRSVFVPDLINERGLDFIERNHDRPFLLYLAHNVPHNPQDPPSLAPYREESWTEGQKAYAASMTRLDGYVGQVIAKLHEFGIEDNTIVVFTSDNGPRDCLDDQVVCLGENKNGFFQSTGGLRGGKGALYEAGIRVPTIVWAPGLIDERAGTTSDVRWAFWDVLPTLADFAGIEPPSDIDGISMRQAWLGKRQGGAHDHLFFFDHTLGEGTWPQGEGHLARIGQVVIRGKWKALRFFEPAIDEFIPLVHLIPDAAWSVELYDLDRDIGETHDVAADHPVVVNELIALMNDAWVPPPFPRTKWTPSCGAAA